MRLWGLVALLACLLCPPALAQAEGPASPIEGANAAFDEPVLSVAVLPIPLLAVYGVAAYDNVPLFGWKQGFHARGGYVWTTNFVHDPTTVRKTLLTPEQTSDFWHLIADWAVQPAPEWALLLDGYMAGGGLSTTPGYDQALTQGISASWGPAIRYTTLDALAFPTRGVYAQANWAPGYHWGAENLAFQRVALDAMRFFPLGGDRTIAVRAVGKAGWPKLAWVDKFYAGGGFFLRGYEWNRFTGDRQLSGTLEYRDLFLPDMLAPLGWDLGMKLGLAFEAFVDAGRAWESTGGVAFPSDLRFGAGTGLMLMLDRVPVGRLEVSAGDEGIFPAASFGAAF